MPRADEVDFDREEQRLVASGNVVFVSDGGCVTAETSGRSVYETEEDDDDDYRPGWSPGWSD